eukprot:3920958-Amphidinium_carterae.1
MPGCLLSDSEAPAMIVFGPLESVKRSAEIRAAALEAYAKLASRERVQRSLRSRNRGIGHVFGQRVWVWRKPLQGRAASWYCPATILSLTPTGAFVLMRGSLWKVNSACLRPQTSADAMIRRFLYDLCSDMSREGMRTQRRYVDATRESPPPILEDGSEAAAPPPESVQAVPLFGREAAPEPEERDTLLPSSMSALPR